MGNRRNLSSALAAVMLGLITYALFLSSNAILTFVSLAAAGALGAGSSLSQLRASTSAGSVALHAQLALSVFVLLSSLLLLALLAL